MTNTSAQDSFLHEAQQSGKSPGNMNVDIDDAIASVNEIMNKDAAAHFKATPENDWETLRLAVYCHDCRGIVPAKISKIRRKTRAICGDCNSVKISMGRQESLERFYHLDKKK